ncbi:MAG: glycosyltransferase family 2 protein [Sedimentisphaerales bacterium]|nr:glycosyltransferase family 2 protein [Sedimentisphaerales bacterium]
MDSASRIISIIVPLLNERENVAELVERIAAAMSGTQMEFEVIVVDDGSTDGTLDVLGQLYQGGRYPWLKIIELRRNFGQTAALSAGFDYARGDVIIPLDGDLQNDPADIPKLITKLDEGYDVVSGWRRQRHDSFILRKIPSWIANFLIGLITGVKLHDYGCTLKAYHKEIIAHINLYGEMHRFIPAIASWSGARVTEIEVTHQRRQRGKSKYGLNRTVKVLLDLITVKFLGSFSTKPIHIFGLMGLLTLLGSFVTGATVLYQKYISDSPLNMNRNPLLTLTVMLTLLSVQFMLMGLLAEMLCRTYHESQNKPTYIIRRIMSTTDTPLPGQTGEGKTNA